MIRRFRKAISADRKEALTGNEFVSRNSSDESAINAMSPDNKQVITLVKDRRNVH